MCHDVLLNMDSTGHKSTGRIQQVCLLAAAPTRGGANLAATTIQYWFAVRVMALALGVGDSTVCVRKDIRHCLSWAVRG